eukprot:12067537-Alexandrium_andersonii.AAC.1
MCIRDSCEDASTFAATPPSRHSGSSCPTWQPIGGAASAAAAAGPAKLLSLTRERPTCALTSI